MFGKCKLCRRRTSNGADFHEKCEKTLFQLNEIIFYYEDGSPPEWLSEALCELAWVYYHNVRTSGYFNVASEISERFIIENEQAIRRNEIRELGITTVPEGEILELLSEGNIITYDDKLVYPGEFLIKARDIAEKGDELGSPEATLKRKEMFGFLAVCLTRALVYFTNHGIPRTALSIFHLLSEQMIRCNEYQDTISDSAIFSAFGDLSMRQKFNQMRRMAGFDPNGEVKIIRDIDHNGTPHLKPCMVIYVDNMRERFRSRDRDVRDRNI